MNGTGAALPRPDAQSKAAGRFAFLGDRDLGDCAWAAVVRSPHPHARVAAIDIGHLRAQPGVVAVFTPDDVPAARFNPALIPEDALLAQTADKPLLTRVARHVGDGVAVVVAQTRQTARTAARLARVAWEVLPAAITVSEALEQGLIAGRVTAGSEKAGSLLGTCPVVVGKTVTFDAAQHVCLEPHTCAAIPAGQGAELWTNAQCPGEIRRLVADVLGLDRGLLRVRKNDEGGGFGAKQDLFEEALVTWLALQLGRGVRLAYSRREEFMAGRVRSGGRISLRLGFDHSGAMIASDMHAVLNSGAYASHTPCVLMCLSGHMSACYPGAAHRFAGTAVRTNTVPAGAYRGYGVAEAAFAAEQLIDLAAAELGLSSLEIRARNVAAGRDGRGLQRCLEQLPVPPPPRREGRVAYGTGIAVAVKHSVTSGGSSDSSSALVLTEPGPKVTLITGTCDSGTGSSTALRQIVASQLGVPAEEVSVVEGDTGTGFTDLGSTAQRSVYIGGKAAAAAARQAADRILRSAARLTGHPVAALRLDWPSVRHARDGSVVADVDRLAQLAGEHQAVPSVRVGAQGPGASYAAVQVTVSVDCETGEVRLQSADAVTDCGQVINLQGARGQVIGGLVQGLGLACMDQWLPGAAGAGPADIAAHAVPGAADVPEINVRFLAATPGAPPTGLGELPIVPVAPAVANALAEATGVRCWHTPLRPADVWQVLQGGAVPCHGEPSTAPAGVPA